MLRFIKKLLPKRLLALLEAPYHRSLAYLSALIYGFPSRRIYVLGITGTKGKTTTAELVNAFLEEAGYKTALMGTLRFKIAEASERNMLKMTMPGRFFIQKFLKRAVRAGCKYAIIEMSSEGAKQFRHTFIDIDTIIFTNLSPEHIESHGSYEKYREAKLSIARVLENSKKPRTIIIANQDDKEARPFLSIGADEKYGYSLSSFDSYTLTPEGVQFSAAGEKMQSLLRGVFNLSNIAAAITFAQTQKVSLKTIKSALKKFTGVRGRVESIKMEGALAKKQNFEVIVDYAHTPDSLKKLYELFGNRRKICVLGGTGGGRDRWKRKEMGKIAEECCSEIILTNEDPYDEDPKAILLGVAEGITRKKYRMILDRREAIREAMTSAEANDAILITGKGTDPYIMGKNDSKVAWDDATVAREELRKVLE